MKILPTQFTKNGWEHKQVQREGLLAIYKRWKNPENPHYEVIKIREGKAYELAGVPIPAAEIYPSAEAFGQYGWTFSGKNGWEQACQKYDSLSREGSSARSDSPGGS